MTRIVLCSSHPLLKAGFRAMLDDAPGEFSLSVCEDPAMLGEHIRQESGRLVMADMASGISLEILNSLRISSPAASIVLWVDNVSTEFISQALSLGVLGVLPKTAGVDLHLECMRQVIAGELWVENNLSKKLLGARRIHLTPRERQLTALLAQGLKNKEVGYRLGISEGTVKVYLSRLYSKLGVSDRLDLALLALKNIATDSQGTERPNMMPPAGLFLLPSAMNAHGFAARA